jgi:hypothetical protein
MCCQLNFLFPDKVKKATLNLTCEEPIIFQGLFFFFFKFSFYFYFLTLDLLGIGSHNLFSFYFYKVITVSWPGSWILRLPMLILVVFLFFLINFFFKIFLSTLSWLRIEFHNCNPSHDFHGLAGWLGFFCSFLIDFNFILQHWLDWELYFIYIYELSWFPDLSLAN